MIIRYDKIAEDFANDFMSLITSSVVMFDIGVWTVCQINTEIDQHVKMKTWCEETLGRQHRGIKTTVFRIFSIPGRWYYDTSPLDSFLTHGICRRYWFKKSSDFEMFKLVWFDELAR
jgi:hypothetical protein